MGFFSPFLLKNLDEEGFYYFTVQCFQTSPGLAKSARILQIPDTAESPIGGTTWEVDVCTPANKTLSHKFTSDFHGYCAPVQLMQHFQKTRTGAQQVAAPQHMSFIRS